MKNILHVSKKGNLKLEESLAVFQKSTNLNEIKRAIEQCEERVFTAWSSVDAKDKAKEAIPIDDLIKQQEAVMQKGGIVNDEHTNAKVGNTLAYKVMINPKSGTMGVLQFNKIDTVNILDDQVWKETQSGDRTGLSVGGFTDKESSYEKKDGEMVKVLNGFNQFETSSVHNPCNPFALNHAVSLVAKSESKKGEMLVVNDKNEVIRINYDNLGKISKSAPEILLGSPQHKKTDNNEIAKHSKESDTTMEKSEVLKVAIEKLTKGEVLSDAEKSAVLDNVSNKEAPKDEKEDAKDDEPKDKKKADGQPESPTKLEEGSAEVIKQLVASQKAQSEQMAALMKTLEGINKTAPVMVQKEAVTKIVTPSPFAPTSAPVGDIPSALDIAYGKKVSINGVQKRASFADVNKMYNAVRKSQQA